MSSYDAGGGDKLNIVTSPTISDSLLQSASVSSMHHDEILIRVRLSTVLNFGGGNPGAISPPESARAEERHSRLALPDCQPWSSSFPSTITKKALAIWAHQNLLLPLESQSGTLNPNLVQIFLARRTARELVTRRLLNAYIFDVVHI